MNVEFLAAIVTRTVVAATAAGKDDGLMAAQLVGRHRGSVAL